RAGLVEPPPRCVPGSEIDRLADLEPQRAADERRPGPIQPRGDDVAKTLLRSFLDADRHVHAGALRRYRNLLIDDDVVEAARAILFVERELRLFDPGLGEGLAARQSGQPQRFFCGEGTDAVDTDLPDAVAIAFVHLHRPRGDFIG